jgi:hypothetical protein
MDLWFSKGAGLLQEWEFSSVTICLGVWHDKEPGYGVDIVGDTAVFSMNPKV